MQPFEKDMTLARIELCQKIEKSLKADNCILGAFYGGSIAENQEDPYSDIDLRLVVDLETFHQFNQFKVGLVNQWGTILFLENEQSTNLLIAHYDTFIKVDLFCYSIESLVPSLWTRQIEIIKDVPSHLLTNLMVNSREVSYSLSLSELTNWQTKFFAYYHEVYRRIKRHEHYYALDCIDKMRQLIVIGWHYQAELLPNSLGDWAKYQGARSRLNNQQQEQLIDFFLDQDLSQLTDVMAELSLAFLVICEGLEKKATLPYRKSDCQKIFDRVDFGCLTDC
ncbi:nucleotidyltransferase domain-containing protein [Vagococcus sp. BWB3-3]|uniref:Nucleotidyltransferase domain-containing protein n=1 Tax=Vagococcus allomyrinae TaxID=2794353 RepID=A0A940P5H0_9ENTE|nr:nucleotidyltransferase domain-containing protein [Vagococcus allomyrinae]MBP1041767.1 nucleotidyltransferase domain-containing protein [Vagococcus allomyrinae]